MSASIPSLLADKLDVSDEKAKKLLLAMLREVKKRAFKEGVRLPEFGTFREHNGELTFEPSPALARAVNRQFEGLESEDLGTAPSEESEDKSSDDGPDTITLGYQDSDWSPLDSEESDEKDAADDTAEDDDKPDTAEFEVPSADEAADTDELQTAAAQDATSDVEEESPSRQSEPEPAAESSPEAPDSSPSGGPSTETEELYPLVEDVPAGAEEEDEDEQEREESTLPDEESAQERERSSLSGIWDSEDDSDDPSDEPSAPPEPSAPSESEHIATAEPEGSSDPTADVASPSESPSAPDAATPSEADSSVDTQDAPPSPDATEEPAAEKSGSTSARVLVGALVVLLLGGAGWYLLGQRGLVPPPQRTIAQLQSQVRTLPLVGSTAQPPDGPQNPDASSPTDTAPAPPDDGGNTEPTTPSVTPSEEPASTSDADAAPPSQPASSSPTLTPSAGGWTVIVGSRAARAPAESLVGNYQGLFPNRNLPVGVLTGEVEGETRYRIGVGQFSSRSDAQRFVEEAGDKLPDGAWILRL